MQSIAENQGIIWNTKKHGSKPIVFLERYEYGWLDRN
jgi:hypothetical protein